MKINKFTPICSLSIFLSFFLTSSLRSHTSIFFTESEIRLIQRNILPQNQENKTTQNSDYLYLSAIIYVNKDHWTLWINQQVIHASDPRQIQGFHIQKVTPLSVEFSWVPPQSTVPIRFTLRSRQVFWGSK